VGGEFRERDGLTPAAGKEFHERDHFTPAWRREKCGSNPLTSAGSSSVCAPRPLATRPEYSPGVAKPTLKQFSDLAAADHPIAIPVWQPTAMLRLARRELPANRFEEAMQLARAAKGLLGALGAPSHLRELELRHGGARSA